MTPVVPVFLSSEEVEFLRPAPSLEERLLRYGFTHEEIERALTEPQIYAAENGRVA